VTVRKRLHSLRAHRWTLLAIAFLAAGLLTAVMRDKHLFPLLWSPVLLTALLTLKSDWDRNAVLGAGLIAAFISATGTQDRVYPILAAGTVCILSVVWVRSEVYDTSWYLGRGVRVSVGPRVARAMRLVVGAGLIVAAILMARAGHSPGLQ
jgi:hypothetical protein